MADYQIIVQPKEVIAQFVNTRMGYDSPWGEFTALGLVRRGYLIAGAIYEGFTAGNVNLHGAAIEGGHWLTPSFLFAMFDYPFREMGKRRVTAPVAKKNKKARKFVESLGFKPEGCLEGYFGNDSLVLYGMQARHCKWIKQPELRRAA